MSYDYDMDRSKANLQPQGNEPDEDETTGVFRVPLSSTEIRQMKKDWYHHGIRATGENFHGEIVDKNPACRSILDAHFGALLVQESVKKLR